MTEESRNHIQVSCALIERDGRILAAQRSRFMNMPLKWEFPGGKIEPGEDPEACLHRELYEEMGIRVSVRQAMAPSTHFYPDLTVTLHPFACTILSGELCLNEHRAAAWITPEEMAALNWTEADLAVIAAYRRHRSGAPADENAGVGAGGGPPREGP
jgi:8-oxo-dGTP diphosphatase